MSFAPSQQPGGNSYYDYQSCALPSPAVDYSATDAPDVDVSLWIWDAADPDFLTCATTGVSFPNGDFGENTTTLGPTLAGHHVEVTAIKSAYPDGLHQCSACGDTGWRGETRYESDWRYGIYLQGCVDQYKNDFFLTSLNRLARDYASTGNETYAKVGLRMLDRFATNFGDFLWKDADSAWGTQESLVSYFRDADHNGWPNSCYMGGETSRGKCCTLDGGHRLMVGIPSMFDSWKAFYGFPDVLGEAVAFDADALAAYGSAAADALSGELGYDVTAKINADLFGRRLAWYAACDFADGGEDLEGGDLYYHIVSNLLPTSFPVDLLEMLPAGHESFAAQLVTFLRVISTKQSREGLWHETYLYSVHAICWVSEVATALLRYCATFPDGAACAGNADELAHLAELSFDGHRADLNVELPSLAGCVAKCEERDLLRRRRASRDPASSSTPTKGPPVHANQAPAPPRRPRWTTGGTNAMNMKP